MSHWLPHKGGWSSLAPAQIKFHSCSMSEKAGIKMRAVTSAFMFCLRERENWTLNFCSFNHNLLLTHLGKNESGRVIRPSRCWCFYPKLFHLYPPSPPFCGASSEIMSRKRHLESQCPRHTDHPPSRSGRNTPLTGQEGPSHHPCWSTQNFFFFLQVCVIFLFTSLKEHVSYSWYSWS